MQQSQSIVTGQATNDSGAGQVGVFCNFPDIGTVMPTEIVQPHCTVSASASKCPENVLPGYVVVLLRPKHSFVFDPKLKGSVLKWIGDQGKNFTCEFGLMPHKRWVSVQKSQGRQPGKVKKAG